MPGLHVPRAVVEELRPGGDSVTVQPRPRGGQTAMVITLNRNSATLSPALRQVKIKFSFFAFRFCVFLYSAIAVAFYILLSCF